MRSSSGTTSFETFGSLEFPVVRWDIWVESWGLGHVTRQINLIDYWRAARGGDGEFRFFVDDNAGTQAALKRAGHDFVVRSASLDDAFASLAGEWSADRPDLFILDTVAQDQIPAARKVLDNRDVFSLVFIDDPKDRDVECDLLVNALPPLTQWAQPKLAREKVRGIEYLILPTEFEDVRRSQPARNFESCDRGVAFFGGSDPQNFSDVFLSAIALENSVKHWTLLVGPSHPDADGIAKRIEKLELPVSLVRYVKSMAAAFADADIAALAAGNTLWEAAAIGVPTIAVSHNPIQAQNATYFATHAGIADAGQLKADSAQMLSQAIRDVAASPEKRRRMSESLRLLVDARGGKRMVEMIGAALRNRASA